MAHKAATHLTSRLYLPVLGSSLEDEEEEVCDMKMQRVDHVGVVVRNLAAAKVFFIDLGLDVVWEGDVEGEWVDRVNGLDGVKVSMAMLRMPDSGANIELIQYHSPAHEMAMQQPA